MRILVTGGTGYIGSHTCVELINAGYDVVIVDNLSNSCRAVVDRIKELTGVLPKFYKEDLLNRKGIDTIFAENKIDAVIHFAGLKAVGESVTIPLTYYHNNLTGTFNLCEAMRNHDCKKIVFSSSATVYGDPHTVPISEDFPLSTTNPYGSTKLMTERILSDIFVSDPSWSVMLLRYFNPIGAHKSGLLGETPNGIPNNLVPYIAQVATGKLECLGVFGDDYDTVDGTGVRDYIHVLDLASGHIKAVEYVLSNQGVEAVNLGTGIGYSVLQIKDAYQKACGIEIPYKVLKRRAGDIATCYADTTKASQMLGWKAAYSIEEMCADSWRFTQMNPNGIEGK